MKRESVATVLVGPNALLREGLARILGAAGYRILASTPDVVDASWSPPPQGQPILLVVDDGDDFETALAQIRSFKQRCAAGRIAMVAHQHNLGEVLSAFQAGANAYLMKVATREIFVKSLELVTLGVTLLPPEILNLIAHREDLRGGCPGRHTETAAHYQDDTADRHPDGDCADGEFEAHECKHQPKHGFAPQLSVRQSSILHRLIQGASNKAIAREMAITEATVKVHVKAILRKIRVHNRTQAAIWAMRHRSFIPASDDASRDGSGRPYASRDEVHLPTHLLAGKAAAPPFHRPFQPVLQLDRR